jgi:hypothetical protein
MEGNANHQQHGQDRYKDSKHIALPGFRALSGARIINRKNHLLQ